MPKWPCRGLGWHLSLLWWHEPPHLHIWLQLPVHVRNTEAALPAAFMGGRGGGSGRGRLVGVATPGPPDSTRPGQVRDVRWWEVPKRALPNLEGPRPHLGKPSVITYVIEKESCGTYGRVCFFSLWLTDGHFISVVTRVFLYIYLCPNFFFFTFFY